MKHRARLLLVVCVAACTYNEYKNYYEAPITTDPDAGSSDVIGAGGSGVGQGGGGGSPGAVAGQGGTALAGNGGTDGSSADACTGCVRISVPTSRSADYRLELDARSNLSTALVLWRVRVRDYVGDVSVVGYVESGDHVASGNFGETMTTSAQLNVASGWQDVGIDLAQVEEFRAPAFVPTFQDGGAAGGGFDPGFPFDKSRVRQVGLLVRPFSQQGTFTPAMLEFDSVTFSTQAGLNVDFSANDGAFELLDPDSATITHVPE